MDFMIYVVSVGLVLEVLLALVTLYLGIKLGNDIEKACREGSKAYTEAVERKK